VLSDGPALRNSSGFPQNPVLGRMSWDAAASPSSQDKPRRLSVPRCGAGRGSSGGKQRHWLCVGMGGNRAEPGRAAGLSLGQAAGAGHYPSQDLVAWVTCGLGRTVRPSPGSAHTGMQPQGLKIGFKQQAQESFLSEISKYPVCPETR